MLTKCKVTSGAAVATMMVGTVSEQQWIRGWALLVAVYAVGLCLRSAIERAAERIQAYIRKWSCQVFEDALKEGITMGREMEATRQFIASAREER